jgi:hypothetical protein
MLFLGRARMLVCVLLSCDLAVIGTAVNCFLFHVANLGGWLNSPWLTVNGFSPGLGAANTLTQRGHLAVSWYQGFTSHHLLMTFIY